MEGQHVDGRAALADRTRTNDDADTTPPNLLDLPNEILYHCFEYVKKRDLLDDQLDGRGRFSRDDDLVALRLTSRRCNAVCSPLFLRRARVYSSPDSLQTFDEISRHLVFQKSVNTVEFNYSFYDASMSRDISQFARFCAEEVSKNAIAYAPESVAKEWLEREIEVATFPGTARFDELLEPGLVRTSVPTSLESDSSVIKPLNEVYKITEEWQVLRENGYREDEATPNQIFLRQAHDEYRRRFDDQERIKNDGTYLKRVKRALSRFTNVQSIIITGQNSQWTSAYASKAGRGRRTLSDEDLKALCLQRLSWRGFIQYGGIDPTLFQLPTAIIPGLLQALRQVKVRISRLHCQVHYPGDLAALVDSSEEERHWFRDVLQGVKTVSFIANEWTREVSAAFNLNVPGPGSPHPDTLIGTLFNPATLQELKLKFKGKPYVGRNGRSSSIRLFPAGHWPQLHTLSLMQIPLRLGALAEFVDNHLTTLKNLSMCRPHLMEGKWADVLDVLRRLKELERVSLCRPQGKGFGRQSAAYPGYKFPQQEAEKYILGSNILNPAIPALLEMEDHSTVSLCWHQENGEG